MEILNYRRDSEINKSDILWSQVKACWPEVSVANTEKVDLFNKEVKICIALCPLYSPGSLSESTLMEYPSIEGSRVSNKMVAYETAIKTINGQVSALGIKASLEVVFVNKGVLFNGQAGEKEDHLLQKHEEVYSGHFYSFARENRISMNFSNYDSWGVNFPTFVDTSESLPEGLKGQNMIEDLNSQFGLSIEQSRKNKDTIANIAGMSGLNYASAFWLIAGYLPFDQKIADIVAPNGLYIAAERFPGLFGIARFTKTLNNLTRVNLNA